MAIPALPTLRASLQSVGASEWPSAPTETATEPAKLVTPFPPIAVAPAASNTATGTSALAVRVDARPATRELTPADLFGLAAQATSFVEGARWRGRRVLLPGGIELNPRVGVMHNGDPSLLVPPRPGHPGSVVIDRNLTPDRAEQLLAYHFAYAAAPPYSTRAQREARARQAELAVWLDQTFVTRQPDDPAWRARVRSELGERLADASLTSDQPLLRKARLLAFVADPSYERCAPGTPGGVRVAGTDTLMGRDLPSRERDTGHIFATVFNPNGQSAHLSFGPVNNLAQSHPVVRERFRNLQIAGFDTRTRPVGDDASLVPFRGAAPMMNTTRIGMLYPPVADPYLAQPPDFSFGFHPSFIDGAAFTEAVERALHDEAHTPARRPYVLATSPHPDEPVGTIDASNCVTIMIEVLSTLRTAQGERVLTADDLALIGLGPDARATPGRDVRPQDLFDLLRFKQQSLS